MLHVPGLFIGVSDERGRGVFTAQALEENDLIEICPVILVPAEQAPSIHQTVLHDYYFIWPDDSGRIAILLGYGSLYNHSPAPNAKVFFDLDHASVEIRCSKNVAAGEELFIDYREGEEDPEPLWFEAL